MKTFKSLLLLLLLHLVFIENYAQKKKPLYTFELGVQTYTFRKSMPLGVAATLDTIKSMGFTELETGVPKGMTAQEYRQLCDERGLKIVSVGGGYDQLVADVMPTVETAKILGAKYVMCAWIPHKVRGGFTFEEAQKAAQDFNKIGKALADNGLIFCYHVHGFEFQPYQNGTLFDYIMQNTNPKHVSFQLDVMWAFHGGADPAALLDRYGKRWKLLHLKDLKKGVKGDLTGSTSQDNDVILGTGQLDLPTIIAKAKKLGIKHYFIEDESSQVNYQVPRSIAYLKSL
ncbi:MAG: sugar phosphate isomerase/epimerase family protein [Runella sp.]